MTELSNGYRRMGWYLKGCLVILSGTLLTLVQSVCHDHDAQICLRNYTQRVQEIEPGSQQMINICGTNDVTNEAYACVDRSLIGEACEPMRQGYTTQIDSVSGLLRQHCAVLNDQNGAGSGCAMVLHRCGGVLIGDDGSELRLLSPLLQPSGGDNQSTVTELQALCRRVENVKADEIKNCIVRSGCSTSSIGDVTDASSITLNDLVDILTGVCEKGCENFLEKYYTASTCLAEKQDPIDCSSLQADLTCVRKRIAGCSVLNTLLRLALDRNDRSRHYRRQCPDVDFTLEQESSNQNNGQSHVTVYVTASSVLLVIMSTVFLQSMLGIDI